MTMKQNIEPSSPPAEEQRAVQLEQLLSSAPLPIIQKSIDAFRRDLPELLKTHRGKWVAYHGDERIGFGRTKTELCRESLRRGLTPNQFVVCGVEESVFDPDEEFEVSSDV